MNERFEQELDRFFRTGEGNFESLALDLFAYQVERNAPYRAYCLAQNATPSTVKSWQEIPAVPIHSFKSSALATFPVGQAAAEFRSSGTTGQTPSRHYFKTLSYYESAVRWGFGRAVMPDRNKLPFLILAPSPGEAPNSSLSWMLEIVLRKWGGAGGGYFMKRGRLEDALLIQSLETLRAHEEPVALLGTTLGFLELFEACERRKIQFRCAPGSRLMDTGGMKTQKREVSRLQFLSFAQHCLGIPESSCINEYGMCEMSSQFYGAGVNLVYKGPPWVRTEVIDPLTGKPVDPGTKGLLRHIDLANVNSVMSLQTEDVGERTPDGFILHGRASQAELKGCSLSAETYLNS